MKYAFNDFVFDSEQLILYKNNEALACRHNEARLLALLLSDPKRIFSKDEILEQVWAGKVVSEQAVFQNISLLRALCGEDAIKTFSKKGYQWQLDTHAYTEPVVESGVEPIALSVATSVEISAEIPATSTTKSVVTAASSFRIQWLFVALTLVLLGLGSFFYWRLMPSESSLPRIALLPLSVEPANRADQNLDAELVQPVWRDLSLTTIFSPVVVSDHQDYHDFFHAPQKYFRQLAQQTRSDLLLGAVVGAQGNRVTVRYALKSEHGFWEATHQAATVAALLEKMNAHIALVLQSKILDVNFSDATLINARLKILHQQAPDDLIVLAQLATSEFQKASANNAVLLAGELSEKARLQGDKSAEAEAYEIAANAYITQSFYNDADTALQKASALYTAIQDYRALNKVQRGYANLAFAKQDYPLFKQALLAAMQFAQQAQDPLLEFRNSTYLSVVANKFGEKADRQTYLDRAELILDQTGQSKELYALVYFYAGMFAESPALAEKHYRKILTMLPADQDWWERERAQVHLTEILLSQSRWQEALDLFQTTELPKASEELMVTKIYVGQKKWDQAEIHGLNTFKTANLTGQTFVGLDTALVLIDIYLATQQPEKEQIYKQFIVKEAANAPYWIRFNRPALEKLAIVLQP